MTQRIEPVPTTTEEIEDRIFKACRRFVTDDAAEAVLELLEAAKQEGRREGLEEAAEICAVAAARLRTGKRIPQVDQHVADTLASKADAIRALIEKDSQT